MSDFEIVNDFVPQKRGGGAGNLGPKAQALVDGQTIFMPVTYSVNIQFKAVQERGYRVRTQKGERDGVKGVYVWAEKNGEVP